MPVFPLPVVWHAYSHSFPPQREETNPGNHADLRSFCLTAPGGISSSTVQEKLSRLLPRLSENTAVQFRLIILFLVTVITGGSAGVSSRVPPLHRSPNRARASSSGDRFVIENGIIGSRRGAGVRGVMPDHWELAFSDPGESHYIE